MTRWLAGPGLPDQLTLDTVQLIAPEKTDLESVKREKKFFATLSTETPTDLRSSRTRSRPRIRSSRQ